MGKLHKSPFYAMIGICLFARAIVASGAIDDGLIAYYPFDGNATDASGDDFDSVQIL